MLKGSLKATEPLTDRGLVLESVHIDGFELSKASEELRGDEEIVKSAAAQEARSLKYASHKMLLRPDIVLPALAQHGEWEFFSFHFVSILLLLLLYYCN